MKELLSLPTPALIALGVLVFAQLSLQVYSLVDLVRRPADRVLGGKKWLWAIVVVLFNLIGAILYLAIARLPAAAEDVAPSASAADRSAVAADLLYGAGTGAQSEKIGASAPDSEKPEGEDAPRP